MTKQTLRRQILGRKPKSAFREKKTLYTRNTLGLQALIAGSSSRIQCSSATALLQMNCIYRNFRYTFCVRDRCYDNRLRLFKGINFTGNGESKSNDRGSHAIMIPLFAV